MAWLDVVEEFEDRGDLKQLEPIVSFTCPKCGKLLEMKQTGKNNLTMVSRFHISSMNHKWIEEVLSEEFKNDSDSRNYLIQVRDAYKEEDKDYCMHFIHKPTFPFTIQNLGHSLPLIFCSINRSEDDINTLQASLNALKCDCMGIYIEVISRNKEVIGHAYIWKWGERYHGFIEGISTAERLVATKHFDDITEFIKKWYEWPGQN